MQALLDPKAQRKAERELQNYVIEMDERSEQRAEYVNKVLAANDESIREIVSWIVEEFRKMEGEPKIVFRGQTYNAIKGETELLERIQERNFSWIAIRLLVACAEWDIRIGNFNLPNNACARCGTTVRRRRRA